MTTVDQPVRRASRWPTAPSGWRALEPAALVSLARFMTSVGFYLAIPFVTFYVTTRQHLSTTDAGILLALLSLTRRGFAIPAGRLTDRLGAAPVLVGGMAVEALAYSGFMLAGSFAAWCLAVTAHGAGGACNNVGTRVILADAKRRGRALNLSRYYVVVNLAALVGPLLGDVFVQTGTQRLAFACAAALHALVGIALYAVLPARVRGRPAALDGRPTLRTVARDRMLWRYCVGIVGGWFALSELYVLVPLDVARAGISPAAIGALTALNALITMLVIWRLSSWIASLSQRGQLNLLVSGAGLLAVSWVIPVVGGLLGLTVAVVVLSIGECMFAAVVDVLAADLAGGPGSVGTYLGFVIMAWGVGAALGSALGGAGFGMAERAGADWLLWPAICVPALVSFAVLLGSRRPLLASLAARLPAEEAA